MKRVRNSTENNGFALIFRQDVVEIADMLPKGIDLHLGPGEYTIFSHAWSLPKRRAQLDIMTFAAQM